MEPRDRIIAFVLGHLPPPGEPWPRIEREWFLAELERLIEQLFRDDAVTDVPRRRDAEGARDDTVG